MSKYSFSENEISVTSGGKVLIELAAPSPGRQVGIVLWWVEFQGTTATDNPAFVDLVRGTAASTGGTAVNVNVVPRYLASDGDPLTTVRTSPTSEGAGGTGIGILERHYVPPTGGLVMPYVPGYFPLIAPGGFLKLKVTPAATVDVAYGIVWEE